MGEDKKNGTICRVCLNYGFEEELGEGLSLFEKYNDCDICEQINALTNVVIREGDGFPDKICPPCLLQLQSAYKFKKTCENTNEILLLAVNTVPKKCETFDGDNSHEILLVPEDSVPAKCERRDSENSHEILLLPENGAPKCEGLDEDFLVKEEYLEDNDNLDYEDDNTPQTDFELKADLKPQNESLSKPSRAIDLKLECHDCGGSFKSKCKLRVHWKKVHLPESLKCLSCLRIFKRFAAFKSHQKRKPKNCATAAKARIEGEGRKRVFHCKDCEYKTKSLTVLAAHLVKHSGEKPFKCDICAKTFTQCSSLTSHKEVTHKLNQIVGTCQFCGKHVQGRNNLYRHIRRHKQAGSGLPCTVCNTVLKTKETLQNHMKIHSGVKSYSCDFCPKKFYTPSALGNHRSIVHVKSKIITCELCGYKTSWSSTMAKHRKNHVTSNFPCNFCGTFLETELQLAIHKLRHTNINCQCPYCEKKYFSKKNLYKHVRKVHNIYKSKSHGPSKVDKD